ncbi:hypothetical protein M0813_27968 [Anaeramoeba flamelloides]|uniref:F5/8 type C domain-containing protein n=1 Tax=Anaeramoeba flamelloides TaxID=1746091 RepID=A0AAV8ACH8_9EUKA|nr:hypothetical protein M0812_05187 [Anaeramoeba flamelloides]KAJ6236311.1 hypothetical protein M0813_27968 [Anaeramoeba flamelloides]
MDHDNLSVKEEITVYNIICNYVERRNHNTNKKLNKQNIKKIMELIRFSFLTLNQLKAVEKNPNVPREMLIESLMARVESHEKKKKKKKSETLGNEQREVPKRFRARPICGTSYDYEEDFDKNGIIYSIGTQKNKKTFKNPSKKQKTKFTIHASSIERGDPLDVTGRKELEFWTKDVPASWVLFDFGPNRLILPNNYTIMHGGNYKADLLRNWDLQGSNDTQNWTVLRQHRNDTSLNGNFGTASWSIDLQLERGFRYLRLLQSGYNSSHHNFLLLSGIEFYGELYELD